MVIKTGDEIRDEVFREFRRQLRERIKAGHDSYDAEVLESAIRMTARERRWNLVEIKKHCEYADPETARLCTTIRLDIEKRNKIYDVQEASIRVLLDDYIRESPNQLTYEVKRNHTVSIKCWLPSGRILSVPISFKRLTDGNFKEEFERGVQNIINFAAHFGNLSIR